MEVGCRGGRPFSVKGLGFRVEGLGAVVAGSRFSVLHPL